LLLVINVLMRNCCRAPGPDSLSALSMGGLHHPTPAACTRAAICRCQTCPRRKCTDCQFQAPGANDQGYQPLPGFIYVFDRFPDL
jgi:hypothetical protein